MNGKIGDKSYFKGYYLASLSSLHDTVTSQSQILVWGKHWWKIKIPPSKLKVIKYLFWGIHCIKT